MPLNISEKIYDISVKQIHNNQQTSINLLSSGSQKLFYIIALTIAVEINQKAIITYEELENSIHPGLLQQLLIIIDGLINNTKAIFTSNSPHLIQYLDIGRIKIGLPNSKGLAIFKEIEKSKSAKILNISADEGVSVGEVIFDKILEDHNGDSELLNAVCNE